MKAVETEILILDCLRPMLDTFGLDENTDAGLVLVALDEVVAQAGISELVVVHHMGHSGERSRGSSRLRDWPDVEWRLVREDVDDPASRRYLSAYGRDVEVTESVLDFQPGTRHLTIAGGSRKDSAADAVLPALIALLTEQPGISGRAIEEALTGPGTTRTAVRAAIQRGLRSAYVIKEPGKGNAAAYRVKISDLRKQLAGALSEQDRLKMINEDDLGALIMPGQNVDSPTRRNSPSLGQHGERECASASVHGARAHENVSAHGAPKPQNPFGDTDQPPPEK